MGIVIPSRLRLATAVLLFAIALAAALSGAHAWIGAVCGGLALVTTFTWMRYGDVSRAAHAYTSRDRDRAWAILEHTPFGGRCLTVEYRIYYHQVRASCLLRFGRWQDAVREAEAALAIRGIAAQAPACHVSAAEAYAHLGSRIDAERHLQGAREHAHNTAVDRGVARVELILASLAAF